MESQKTDKMADGLGKGMDQSRQQMTNSFQKVGQKTKQAVTGGKRRRQEELAGGKGKGKKKGRVETHANNQMKVLKSKMTKNRAGIKQARSKAQHAKNPREKRHWKMVKIQRLKKQAQLRRKLIQARMKRAAAKTARHAKNTAKKAAKGTVKAASHVVPGGKAVRAGMSQHGRAQRAPQRKHVMKGRTHNRVKPRPSLNGTYQKQLAAQHKSAMQSRQQSFQKQGKGRGPLDHGDGPSLSR